MKKQLSVLVIEDGAVIIVAWQRSFEDLEIQITPALNLEEACRLFPIKAWDAIVVDGCLGGNDFNTEELVRAIRKDGYQGPMITASTSDDLRMFLIRAGCSHEAEKNFVPAVVVNLLLNK